jgi:hypothetical protein
MANVEIIPAPSPSLQLRAGEVLARIIAIRDGLFDKMFDLAELLKESKDGAFHLHWGFSRFEDWVEKGSGLDISARTAFYLINIVEKARELGISRDKYTGVKISKLKAIFSLDAKKHGEEIRLLLETADSKSLEEIQSEVWKIKTDGKGEEFAYITIKVPKSVKEDVVDLAFEEVRRIYGDIVDEETGEVKEATPGKCLELICVEFIQDAHRKEVKRSAEMIPQEVM